MEVYLQWSVIMYDYNNYEIFYEMVAIFSVIFSYNVEDWLYS